MTSRVIREALRRLDELTSEEVFFVTTSSLSKEQMREALRNGRLDPRAFMHNAAHVADVVAAEAHLRAAEDSMLELRLDRATKQPVQPSLRVVGGGGHE